jgi:hypothetical protein
MGARALTAYDPLVSSLGQAKVSGLTGSYVYLYEAAEALAQISPLTPGELAAGDAADLKSDPELATALQELENAFSKGSQTDKLRVLATLKRSQTALPLAGMMVLKDKSASTSGKKNGLLVLKMSIACMDKSARILGDAVNEDGEPSLRACEALGSVGTGLREAFALLPETDAGDRAMAARLLVEIARRLSPGITALSQRSLKAAPIDVAAKAVEALMNTGPPASSCSPDLIKLLQSNEPALQAGSALALGFIGPRTSEAASALIRFGAEQTTWRPVATQSLSFMGPAALPRLFEATRDQDKKVQDYAREVVQRITGSR